MEQTSPRNIMQPLLIFIVVAVILLAAIILGVRFAKSRSDHLGAVVGQSTQQTAPTNTTKTDEQKKAEDKQKNNQSQQVASQPPQSNVNSATTNKPNTSSPTTTSTSNTTPSNNPSHVPTTGIGDVFLSIIALSVAVFAAINYMKSRRRLARVS